MSKDGTRKNHTDIGERKRTVHSFLIRTILKEQWDLLENKNNQGWIRTIKAEINTKNFLSHGSHQKNYS